ncbi:Uncharacterized protein TCM_041649 [Theobroma cacao]|uniref:Uncharacterized protein n=1 Tax=Theobroma cacao TaxID=3641 RepID=A0A061GVA8_THECC|nr:Uncharacterized protein TCM_041649 [Theobroma cacao]
MERKKVGTINFFFLSGGRGSDEDYADDEGIRRLAWHWRLHVPVRSWNPCGNRRPRPPIGKVFRLFGLKILLM